MSVCFLSDVDFSSISNRLSQIAVQLSAPFDEEVVADLAVFAVKV